ncbi:MAG: hypothetical protein ACE366_15725 [Bradymonadia bacterium]
MVTLGSSVALCFVPLFNLLAFEFALAMTVPITLLGAAAGIRTVKRARRYWGPALLRSSTLLWRMWLTAVVRALPLALLPLLPITLNALRVTNCNYLEGLLFYGLLPGITLPVACGWGVLAALAGRWPRIRFTAGVLLTLVAAFLWFWFTPAVDVFHPFVGYFPGSIYDEVLLLDGRLLWSRVHDLLWVIWALSLARVLYTPLGVRLRIKSDAPSRLLSRTWGHGLMLLLCSGAMGAMHFELLDLDLYRTPSHVQRRLGGALETAHLNVYFPAAWSPEHVDPLVKDLTFIRGELVDFFGFEPTRKIDVYLYPDAQMKKRLMGAGRTRIAKPWQYGFHVHRPQVGQDVTMHEMAHVFSADIANGPHHLSLSTIGLPNMALIEGLAEAATWDGDLLDFHQWSAAMHDLEIAPPIEGLLQPQGFYAYSSRQAYTVCGSFVRFLRDTRGADVMATAYRTGDVASAAGEPLSALVKDWQAYIEREPLGPIALEAARVRFDRPSIFGKVCAHEIAALRAVARQRHDLPRALAAVETILTFIPNDPLARLDRIDVLYRNGDLDEAAQVAAELAADDRVGRQRQARAREWQGDLAARRGDIASARAHYSAVLASAFERGQARRVAVKHSALDEGAVGQRVLDLLTAAGQMDRDDASALIADLVHEAPDWPVARYLAARQQVFSDEPEDAIRGLRAALAGGLPHPALKIEALRLVGVARFRAKAYAEAAEAFAAVAARTDLGIEAGERHGLERWARRSRAFGDVRISRDH